MSSPPRPPLPLIPGVHSEQDVPAPDDVKDGDQPEYAEHLDRTAARAHPDLGQYQSVALSSVHPNPNPNPNPKPNISMSSVRYLATSAASSSSSAASSSSSSSSSPVAISAN